MNVQKDEFGFIYDRLRIKEDSVESQNKNKALEGKLEKNVDPKNKKTLDFDKNKS